MKPVYYIYLFFAALIANISGIFFKAEFLEKINKPLLIPILIVYFITSVKFLPTGFSKLVLLALFFSWLGDVLLMFVSKNENFFLAGLASFLIAHVFYIILFHQIKLKEKINSQIWTVLIVAAYYAGLLYLLNPHLGAMKLPVRVYGIVISFMCMLALHFFYLPNKVAGINIGIGALLFVISDSILAINKFYQPFEMAGLLIMLTYGAAQFFIVKGLKNYLSSQ